MKWTDKLPTEPGWYWFKTNREWTPRVVQVWSMHNQLHFDEVDWCTIAEYAKAVEGCRWIGPLAEPPLTEDAPL